ncbi:MAG: hypothetical protein LBV71_03890 [Prevotella sp.]|jgi:hypothetical protein|nr:hypothetical protein [Prevotella sp.]
MALSKTPTIVKGEKQFCDLCKKEHLIRVDRVGDPVGSSSTLGRNIMQNKARKNHPLHYTSASKVIKAKGSKTCSGRIRERDEEITISAGSLQAHHLICSATFGEDNEKWRNICVDYTL